MVKNGGLRPKVLCTRPSSDARLDDGTIGDMTYLGFQLGLVAVAQNLTFTNLCTKDTVPSAVAYLLEFMVSVMLPSVIELEVMAKDDYHYESSEVISLRDPLVLSVLEQNRLPLWAIYRHYCPPKGTSSRQQMSLSFDKAWR